MNKNKVKKFLSLVSFLLTVIFIVSIFGGNFVPSKLFASNPIQKVFKSVILSAYPEWKPIENDLNANLPNTVSNVSINHKYDVNSKDHLELHVSIVTNGVLTNNQLIKAKNIICNDLINTKNKYESIVLSAGDLKSYSHKEAFTCPLNTN